MNINKKIKSFYFIATLILIAILSFTVFEKNNQVSANNIRVVNSGFKDTYELGEEITISAALIAINGITITSQSAVVIFPSGIAKKSGKVILDEAGQYTVMYSAMAFGKPIKASTTFKVNKMLYGFSNPKSSAYYGTHPVHATTQAGIVVSVMRGDTFKYNRIINLSDNTKDDRLLRFFVTPEEIGIMEAQQILITLTDLYDTSNRINIYLENLSHTGSWADPGVYIDAETGGQIPVGLGGINGEIVRKGGTGYAMYFSLLGKPYGNLKIGQEFCDFYFDYQEKKLYTSPDSRRESGYNTLIVDLDEPSYFDNPWRGFTTGEAYLTITGINQTKTFNYVITEIDGHDLTSNNFSDDTVPLINVNMGSFNENNLIHAIVGEPYPVFSASATDAYDGELPVNIQVYYNYRSQSRGLKSIINNCFTPAYEGEYSIVYTAFDSFGNKAEKVIDIIAENVSQQDKFSFSLSGKPDILPLGSVVKVFDDITFNNVRGKESYIVEAVNIATGKKYKVDGNNTFFPETAGNYSITVTARDFISQYSETYDIEISSETQIPALPYDVVLPKYFIKGAPYVIPSMNGYKFINGVAESVMAEISIEEDGELKNNAIINGKYISNANTTAKIIYKLTAGGITTQKSYEVPVINTGYKNNLNIIKYFQAINGSFSSKFVEQGYIDFISFTTSSYGALEFINAVQTADFSFEFDTVKDETAFSAIDIYLTDSIDSSVKLKFSYQKTAGNTALSINNKGSYFMGMNFCNTGSSFYRLIYNNNTRKAKLHTNINIVIDTDLYGNEFRGFPSGFAYLEIDFVYREQDSGLSSINIISLNNQNFYEISSDNVDPQIIVDPVKGDRSYGDKLVLPSAIAADVLDTNLTFKMMVTAPDGSIVITDDGIRLDETCNPNREYTISLLQYGDYIITYSANDSDNDVRFSYGVSVINSEPPLIVLKDIVSEAKVGDTIRIATATVSAAGDVEYGCYLILPSGVIVKIEGYTFIAVEKGTYYVLYGAFDTDYNYSTVSYKVIVTDKE
jgi:hypothetical protein